MRSVLIILLLILKSSMADKKVWTSSKNIQRSENWESVRKNCTGLIFAEYNRAVLYIEKINVQRLVLPRSGQVSLSMDAKISFGLNTGDIMNCVTLRPIHPSSWLDFTLWNNTDDPLNIAVPYLERPPSRYDTALLPEYPNILFDETVVSRLESRHTSYMSADDDSYYIPHQVPQNCTDKAGCLKSVDTAFHDIICDKHKPVEDLEVNCKNPIYPWGFCGLPKCGGLITIGKLKSGFEIQKIEELSNEFQSFVHVSRLPESSGKKAQIFFTEKIYTGDSIIDSTELFHMIQSDESLLVEELELEVSGEAIHGGLRFLAKGMSILFGTLLGALILLGLFYAGSTSKISPFQYTLRICEDRTLASFNMHYDKIDDRTSIIDQSVAGSLWNLNNSFDNPMTEQHSSRKTSCETIGSTRTEIFQDMTNNKANGETLLEPGASLKTQIETIEHDDDLLLKEM